MVEKTFNHPGQKDMFEILDNIVKKYTSKGTSLPQAISLVCKEYGFNPYKIIDTYYPEIKPEELNTYKDIKTEEGSFVTLKNDSTQKHYEVININNKDAIVLRNTDNNREITASEEEITPVITENKMNKLNEAQYNISINGLETEDAATLSQMLSLADQAENVGGSMLATDGMQNDMALNPMPMDDMGMPMDMEAPVEEPVVDDIEFDEELPTEELDMEEPIEAEMEVNVDADPLADVSMVDDAMDSELPMEEPVEDMSMDDMMDAGMYDEDIMGESFDYDALIKEAMEAAGIETLDEEVKEIIPSSEDIADENEQERYAEELVEADEDNWDKMTSRQKRIMSDVKVWCENIASETGYIFEKDIEDMSHDVDMKPAELTKLIERLGFEIHEGSELSDEEKESQQKEDDRIMGINRNESEEIEEVCEEVDFEEEIAEALRIAGVQLDEEFEEEIADESEEIEEVCEEVDFEEEIAEALRIAGIQLDEAEASKPIIVDDETLYINKENEDQEPEYHEVETDTFGKEASEGMKTSMTFEAAVNTKKIESIYETAKSMYAKKETSEWMSLDRRYIEKLIKEGVGYEKASKMIMNAKKGK